ncbi:MAG TPA: 50S ribosomal protein L11 methyltransferase [Thermoanaerobaculia bacterium]|jgi:protein arginine N-methyltransferase 1|nr:50S ribosomal protein L11 methyltransferase [Thermoanaerobaculia bacterium]
MEWHIPYTVSRAVVLQINAAGQLVARNSVSRDPHVLKPDGLPVLLAFANGATPTDALTQLRTRYKLAEDGFATVVGALVEQNLLTPVDGADSSPVPSGFGSGVRHFMMVRDSVRVMSYCRAIQRHCRDKVVVEIGCGSGILSIFAAQAGARRVIAIEESRIADLAEEMFRANGVADRIELRRANSRNVSLDERADVIIHEILGSDPFSENLLPFIQDARERFLAPNGRLIPSALEVFCAGFDVPDRPYLDLQRATAELVDLEGLYGIDFSAFRRALESEESPFRRPLGDLSKATQFEPPILTEETRLYRLDLGGDAPLGIPPRRDLSLRVIRAGSLGGLLLYFRAHLDEETFLSTAPYAPRTSWAWDARPLDRLVTVEPGQDIPIVTELRTVLGMERLWVALA